MQNKTIYNMRNQANAFIPGFYSCAQHANGNILYYFEGTEDNNLPAFTYWQDSPDENYYIENNCPVS